MGYSLIKLSYVYLNIDISVEVHICVHVTRGAELKVNAGIPSASFLGDKY